MNIFVLEKNEKIYLIKAINLNSAIKKLNNNTYNYCFKDICSITSYEAISNEAITLLHNDKKLCKRKVIVGLSFERNKLYFKVKVENHFFYRLDDIATSHYEDLVIDAEGKNFGVNGSVFINKKRLLEIAEKLIKHIKIDLNI